MADFAEWFARQLDRKGWGRSEFSGSSGVPVRTVGAWLTGDRVPGSKSCDRIADVLGVDVDTVLTLAGHRPHIDEPAPDDELAAIFSRIRRLKLDPDELRAFGDFVTLWERQTKDNRKRRRG